jgi:hypothetical protein
MATKKQGNTKVTTIKLTDDQRAAIEQATGVSLKELSLIEQSGAAARAVNMSRHLGHVDLLQCLKSVTVVMCW